MASKKMILFNVLKLNTSFILQQGNNISLDYDDACKRGLVIALGDNQLFNFVRRLTNNTDVVNDINTLEKRIKLIRKEDSSVENTRRIRNLQKQLDVKKYCPDIISVKCDSAKKDYKSVCKTHFVVDMKIHGKSYKREYRRLCAGAGQLRRNSAIFCSVDLYDELNEIMMCGLTKKTIGSMNLAKFSAYFALYTSSSRQVTTPRICVIPDYEYTLKNQLVDWIYDNNGEKDVEERHIDFEINAFDGSGMISPRMMKQWCVDLKLDYIPTSFIIRAPWVKGLVSVFDFHRFAKEVANKDSVVDLWGKSWPIEEIDIILTASQFKMYKKYSSWEQYIEAYNKYGHIFSITRVNKKHDNLLTPLNYQYVQTNNFSVDDIKALADYSLNWIKKLMTRDYLYTLLFLSPNADIEDIANNNLVTVDDKITLAMMYNPDIVNDDYVNKRIIRHIQNKIDKMKIGKVFVEGAYEFIIPDLYAMAEHAFGMEVHGLLPANSLWNRKWVEKGSTKVTAHRSPLVAPSENRILDVYSNDKCMDWFSNIHSGNIMNIHDMTVIAMSDADFDGDLILTTDNPIMVKAVGENGKVITYAKTKTKEQPLNVNSFATMDTRSFNPPIGQITNLASNLIALKSIYKPDSDEYKELERRIKLLRYYQGSAIDATKGDVYTPPPKHWSKKQKFITITDDMSISEVADAVEKNKEIAFNNKIAVDRKAYFFGYVYPKLKTEYDLHVKMYRDLCRQLYNSTMQQLVHKESKNEKEQKIVKGYYRYMPLLRNNCTMNTLSYYVEDVEKDCKWRKNPEHEFDFTVLLSKYFEPTDKILLNRIYRVIREAFFEFDNQMKVAKSDSDMLYDVDSFDELEQNIFVNISNNLRKELYNCCSNTTDLSNYVIYCFYTKFKNKSKSWLWEIFGEEIISHLKSKTSTINIPVESDDGIEYLCKKYKLESVVFDDSN